MLSSKETTQETINSPTRQAITFGYARVSTIEQSEKYGLEVQIAELEKQGIDRSHIFTDIESGAIRDRPQLVRLLDIVKQGDTIIIPKLDRLARSMLHLLQIIEQLNEKGVKFKSIHDSGIDTTTPSGKLFLGIMASIAEFERAIIKERTQKGIQAKIAENYQKTGRANWGRKPTSSVKLEKAKEDLINGKSHTIVAELYSIPRPTLYRLFPAKLIEQWRLERLVENKNDLDRFESKQTYEN